MPPSRKPKGKKCVLCGAPLKGSAYPWAFLHPLDVACNVRITDNLGLSLDDQYEIVEGEVCNRVVEEPMAAATPIEFGGALFTVDGQVYGGGDGGFASADEGIAKLFEAVGKPHLGGASGPRGWSSVSSFQRCRYLWKHKFGGGLRGDVASAPTPPHLQVGSLAHVFLAIHYMQRIDPLYPLDPENARRFLESVPVTPDYLREAWELFDAYRAYWGDEPWMIPLAVEELAVDPRTGFSCRWDLVFKVEKPWENLLPGVYVCNSKTSATDGLVTREQWRNDGQIIGEIDLYERLGYHRRWGQLRGACVNLLIKTKAPKFDRIWVYPSKGVRKDHHRSLQIWSAEMEMALATGDFRRSRSACVTQYRGLCDLFDHCSGADGSEPREIG